MKSTNTSEITIWQELKKGSTIALGQLYDKYADELFLFGCKVTGESSIVQDSIHDMFLDLYKYHSNLSDTSNVKFYLLRSLKNKILKHPEYKKLQVAPAFKLETDFLSETSTEESLIEQEVFNENLNKLSKAILLLPKKQRQGITLKFMQNKTYEEIAEIMDIKVETSRTIVYRGIKSLREICVLFIGFILSIW
ncbi:DNA-directed RNA polymerase sigma-70 factor [Neptunitalea chrysea]|uniref:DNA-directed RNA polymerase sigma-70 factor n=1 Tax=Neptunitalea chrysea TaxID=1647581 RepID=A0A9W6EWH0_9FLAO|nr:sigma-70 family RNA polymerase sigma factor [Neptunitalea chrysea]GLB53887.1 DNA-directed RNA polymerase sigma-70 factor [Neptunitalea chrysea]